MTILTWDRPAKIMTTEQWQRISADGAPPGVYTPNMSGEDAARWKAKLIQGANRRVEIRRTVTGTERHGPRRRPHYAQLLVIVDAYSVRMSCNGTVDLTAAGWDEFASAVVEARAVLKAGAS